MFLFRRLCLLACLTVVVLQTVPTGAQEKELNDAEPNPAAVEPSSDLPKTAVWRIGEFGKTPKANGIYRVAYSRDGKLLATRNRENLVTIYDVANRQQLCEVSGHDNNWIETIDFSPDGKYFATAAGSSEKVKIWNSQNGKLEGEIETDANAAYFSADGRQLIIFGTTHVERYSWPGVQMISQKNWYVDGAKRAAMSRDGNLVVYYKTNNLRIYQTSVVDLENKSRIDLSGATAIPKSVVVSNNNLWVAASYHREPKIWLWDLRDPHQAKYQLSGHKETVQALAFSPDNRILVSSSWDEKAIAWDLLSRQAIGEYVGHTEHVNSTAVSPVDFTFATGASGTTDTSTIIWDLTPAIFSHQRTYANASFNQLWNGMGASSVKTSLAATAKLAESPQRYLPLLAEQIHDSLGEKTTVLNVVATIKQLDDRSYAVRESATQKLMMQRGAAERLLREALEQTNSIETRYRITKILQQPIERPKINFTELRRWHRIVLALERIDSSESSELLKLISENHPDVDVATDARDAIHRNQVRKSEL